MGPNFIWNGTFRSNLGMSHSMIVVCSPVNNLKMFDGLESKGMLMPKPPSPLLFDAPLSVFSSDFVFEAPGLGDAAI
ncbi:hypothetical protein Pla52n_68680 [Stieleria varia]|uniref:Uncharacterized protein n=1 Tax=Stieleria varia TaxID=2528005 RepID=A0A5C5ZP43_9BACT|nr:hypothetical protein Pla52n_68680 [Stieleria varia]